MNIDESEQKLLRALEQFPRTSLAQLPTPMHRLVNLSKHLGGIELWIKRDDLTGLAGGGNKTRKLEFLVGDARREGADTLVSVGAIQSNHTRQTAAAAARAGLKCALLHCAWTEDSGPYYRVVGNLLLSSLMGAELYSDATQRPIEDETPIDALAKYIARRGGRPYLIPAGASEHRLGSLGYSVCAAEIMMQSRALGVQFDFVVHTTGSSSTQSGLLAGFAALKARTRVIGVADDYETAIKRGRVKRLANDTLNMIGFDERLDEADVEIVASDLSAYGVCDEDTIGAIRLLARTEGLIADPVYEGKALRGLIDLVAHGRFARGSKVLLLHLGGSPALHAYANRFGPIALNRAPTFDA